MAKSNKNKRKPTMEQQVELIKNDDGRHRFRSNTLEKTPKQKNKKARAVSKRQLRDLV